VRWVRTPEVKRAQLVPQMVQLALQLRETLFIRHWLERSDLLLNLTHLELQVTHPLLETAHCQFLRAYVLVVYTRSVHFVLKHGLRSDSVV
jgi:hypothetical protein